MLFRSSQYFSTPFNNDLVSLYAFSTNCDEIRRYVEYGSFAECLNDHFLCYGVDADNLILVDAEKDITTFFTLLSAGFTPLTEAPHIMLIPAKETTIQKEGSTFNGYATVPDSMGIKWFISECMHLVGQI